MSKRKPLGSERYNLVAGSNELRLWTDNALIEEIQFQSTCDTVITRVFHGAKNLLTEKQMLPMAGEQIVAGPGRTDQRDACLLKLVPPERFHLDLVTTFVVLAEKDGTMIVSLYGPSAPKTEEQRQQAEAIIRKFFAEKKIKFTPFDRGHVSWVDDRQEWVIQAEVVCSDAHLEDLNGRLRAAGLL